MDGLGGSLCPAWYLHFATPLAVLRPRLWGEDGLVPAAQQRQLSLAPADKTRPTVSSTTPLYRARPVAGQQVYGATVHSMGGVAEPHSVPESGAGGLLRV